MHKDDRGWSWWDVFPREVKQVNVSWLHPGAIKGMHCHKIQDDYWFCAVGALLVVTAKDLELSGPPLSSVVPAPVLRSFLYPGDIQRIPAGTWHGCRAIGKEPALLLYGVTTPFDINNPDELRRAWNFYGEGIWEMQPK